LNAYEVVAVMTVKVEPPRVNSPTADQRKSFTDSMRKMTSLGLGNPRAKWTKDSVEVQFHVEGDSEVAARDAAVNVLTWRARYDAKIAGPDDLAVEFVRVTPVEGYVEMTPRQRLRPRERPND